MFTQILHRLKNWNEERIRKNARKEQTITRMAWPIFIEISFQLLVTNVDQLMISRYSELAVTAVDNANQVMNLTVLFFSIASIATMILAGKFIGAGENSKLPVLHTLSILTNTVIGIIVSLSMIFLHKQIYGFMQVQDILMKDASTYIMVVGGTMFLQSLIVTFTAIFRSQAMPKETMLIVTGMNILNVILNYLLIFGPGFMPELGVLGAAIATAFSRLVCVVAFFYVYRKRLHSRIAMKYLKPFPTKMFWQLMRIGIPAAGESISYYVCQIFVQRIVNTVGLEAATAKAYVNMFCWVSYIYGMARAQAAQIHFGYMVGQGQLDLVKKTALKTLRIALTSTAITGTIVFLLGRPIMGLLTDNPAVIELGKWVLFFDIFAQLGRTGNVVLIRALQSANDINYIVLIALINTWTVQLGLAYVFGIVCGWGLLGVWGALAMDEISRATGYYIRWKRDTWRKKVAGLSVAA